jgi:hypothetical protein
MSDQLLRQFEVEMTLSNSTSIKLRVKNDGYPEFPKNIWTIPFSRRGEITFCGFGSLVVLSLVPTRFSCSSSFALFPSRVSQNQAVFKFAGFVVVILLMSIAKRNAFPGPGGVDVAETVVVAAKMAEKVAEGIAGT